MRDSAAARHLFTGHGCRVAPAYARPSTPRSRRSATGNAAVAIHPRVFRPRVLDAASHRWRFVPRNRCGRESAARRAGTAAYERRSRSRPQRPQARPGSRARCDTGGGFSEHAQMADSQSDYHRTWRASIAASNGRGPLRSMR